jgi:hypothetical protein
MTTKFGEFSAPAYIGIGDPYVKRNKFEAEDRTAFRPTGTVKKMK